MRQFSWIVACCVFCLCSCTDDMPPASYGALPTDRHMAWHEMEYYAFVHFNMNTFSGEEWGHGEEPPSLFDPTELDTRQWAQVAKEAGMKGIVITAKHHDGFCLWDSQYTEHDVASSPWKNGKGDLLEDLAEACKEYGLKMGVYLSPWDQNSPVYGTEGYNEYFMNQLEEVLTQYGDIFEVWFDGAVGPEYKGMQPYDWDGFIAKVREHQPEAVIFSDAGPDIRWVGTEKGFANPTNWSTLNRDEYYPGTPRYLELRSGNQNGSHWLPAEVDVSIRPGWYYHADEDEQVKSADHLEWIYYNSVGRNGNLLLNLPVDRRGLVHENDVAALMALRERLDATFTDNKAASAKVSANTSRGNSRLFSPMHLNDGHDSTYWATNDRDTTAQIQLKWASPQTFNIIELEEYIPLGQRIESWEVDAFQNGEWQVLGRATTVGNRRWMRIPKVTTDRLRIRITDAMAELVVREIGVYHRPHDNYLLESKAEFDERMSWWRDAKFGMFIHWGAYAVPAGRYKGKTVSGIAEWIMYSANIPVSEYETYVSEFNPVAFDAQEWVQIAKSAGMEYIVITSKHHDGFSIWDSEVTEYDIIDAAPYGRDILSALKEACDEEGIRLGFYHSIMDWHHPDANKESFAAYRDAYMIPQLEELIANYDPDILWFDGEWIEEWDEPQGKNLYQKVRSLKPNILINNRVGKGRQGMQGMNLGHEYVGDFGTPEQEILDYGSAELDWESCMTMNDSWGYKLDDENWKSEEILIHNLVDVTAKGGNYLLNVGPDAKGLIPTPSVERLQAMGEWLTINKAAIKNTSMWTQWHEGETIRYTQGKDGYIYAITLVWPSEYLLLKYIQPEAGSTIELLGYDGEIEWSFDPEEGLRILIPDRENVGCDYAWVFKIQGKGATVSESPIIVGEKNEPLKTEIFTDKMVVSMVAPDPGASIYYTTDGTEPSPDKGLKYEGPISIYETTDLQVIAKSEGAISSLVSSVSVSRSKYNGLNLKEAYALQYDGGGDLGLVDGRTGDTNFKHMAWQGYEGVDLIATIDLGNTKEISQMEIRFLQDLGPWIFPPKEVRFLVSKDGVSFREVKIEQFNMPTSQDGPVIHNVVTSFEPTEAAYARIVARNVGTCPDWHPGAGGKAWMFADELSVK